MTTKRAYALAAVPPIVAAGASTLALLVLDLPQRLAVHWGPTGVDRVGGVGDLIAPMVIGVVLITATMLATLFAKTRGATTTGFVRAIVGTTVLVGVSLALSILATGVAQQGLDDPTSVPVSAVLGWTGLGLLVALAAAVGAALLVPKVAPSDVEPEGLVAAMDLGPTERASWSRTVVVSPIAMGIISATIIATCVVLLLAGGPPLVLLVPAVLFAVIFALLAWRVRVDGSGLVARSVLGLPVIHVPLATVTGARAIDVNPITDFGGWGLRFGNLGWGIVMRRGSAIAVDRANRTPFVITVDDAETAASLLTAMALRAREG